MARLGKRFLLSLLLALGWLTASPAADAEPSGATGDFYQIAVVKKRSQGKTRATVQVAGRSGYHCNTLYQWKLTVSPGKGIALAKTTYGNGDAAKFAEDGVAFEIAYTGGSAEQTKAELKFSVCNDKQCLMEKVDLSW